MQKTLLSLAALAVCSLSASLTWASDTITPGFAITASSPAPAYGASYATLSDGRIVTFDSASFDLFAADGTLLQNLGTLPAAVWASFVEIDPSETYALIGESQSGDVFSVDLSGAGVTTVANLPYNFDAVFDTDPHFALISAAICGWGCGNDIVRLEVATGTVTSLAQIAGPSGPLALNALGELYYGTQDPAYPAPPASTDIIYWTAAQLASGAPLDETNATLLAAGFDGASALAVDPASQNLFVAENLYGVSGKIHQLDRFGARVAEVASGLNWLSNMEFMLTGGADTFQAWQPGGVTMIYRSDDFTVYTTDRVTITPARPTATISGSVPGAITVTFDGCLPDAAVLLTWGNVSYYNADEFTYDIGLGFPLHFAVPLAAVRRQPFPLPTDGNGTAVFTYYDLGAFAGTLEFQAVLMDQDLSLLGTSSAVLN
ncbi:MAG: hypothetical protein QF411_06335 [Planctomycetota bacterium]|nr:hypothetical protein [Planctomycetota bacterium]